MIFARSCSGRIRRRSVKKLVPHFGLEDVKSCGERLASFLLEEKEPVVAIAPILVDRERKRTAHPEKSDSLDARGVAFSHDSKD